LARVLSERGWRVVLATDARGAKYAETFPAIERLALEAATFSLKNPIAAVQGWLRIQAGVKRARQAYARLTPTVVVGFGGYPSLPALLAARQAKIPRLIHELNAVLGRVNRYLAKRVDTVACAFPILQRAPAGLKHEVVGNPVRPDIRALYDQPYVAPGGTLRLLVTGGSQGATLLSETVPAAVAMLPEALRLILRVEQQTRMETLDFARRTYREVGVEAEVAPFFRNMAARLSQAHLVIGRAGASTVCELAVAGRPSILVPLAIAADDHQRFNAEMLADAGATVILPEPKFTPKKLAEVLEGLLTTPQVLEKMARGAHDAAKPDAAERLADLVEQASGKA
jgi:UDP-N-acetylglucosamine--N-acetylmuramyl-(pentapeptide) pyrophosphoryl-undecaprenol N-acetylglucosamine transferase